MKSPAKVRRASLGKEGVLLFLAAFYFLIATNTQSGWLFLLSAFLLGLLAMCWLPPRRAAARAHLERELIGSPQRGVPMLVRLRLSNQGARPLREVLVVEPACSWAQEQSEIRWVISRLAPGESASTEYSITPARRGEHRLAGSELSFGAPFGLFTVTRKQPDSDLFVVYPRLITLSPRRQSTRLAGILTEFAAPRSKGDSRSLRSLREYQAGDDLRLVHWKSSAKTGGSTLLVREHHAPSRQLSLLLLDTSSRASGASAEEAFERAIMLAASLLWSAHRAGTRSTLLLFAEAGWQALTRWEEQYTGLARVEQRESLAFTAWQREARKALDERPEARMGAHPVLITRAGSRVDLGEPSDWPTPALGACLLVPEHGRAELFSDYPVVIVDVDDGHVKERLSHV